MSLQQKVSSAIRILRWNRDVSARASHLVEVFNFQAGSGNVSGSTFSERKNMSTKTSFKRIAAVAAVALAIGGLTSVAANATATSSAATLLSGSLVSSGPGSATLGTQVAGGIATVVLTETATAGTAGDTLGTLSSTGVGTINTIAQSTNVTYVSTASFPTTSVGIVARTTSAANGEAVTITVSSAVAGVQTLSFTPISASGAPGTAITAVITWGAAPVVSAQYSTAYSTTSHSAIGDATSDALGMTGVSTYGVQAGLVTVKLNSALSTGITAGLSATITGPGLLGLANDLTTFTASAAGKSLSTSAAAAVSGNYIVAVYADGTAGTSTVTITSGTTAIATKTVVFTGSAKALTATQNLKVLKAGGTAGAAAAGNVYNGTTAAGDATTVLVQNTGTTASPVWTAGLAPITVFTTDSLGAPVTITATDSAVIKVVSSDSTVLTAGTCVNAVNSVTAATNEINCVVTGTSGALSGSTATATVELYNSTTAAWDILATPLTFTIGGSVSSEVMTVDSDTYAPNQPVKLSLTAKDSKGNTAYDQDIAGAALLTSSTYMVGLATPTKLKNGVATKSTGIYAPATSGAFTISGVDGDSVAGEALSATASVTGATDAAAQAATDAAQEATDAANAAYDAANNAMDSADAATAAAQDASDNASAALAAVTSLSATVAKLVKSVTAITTALASIKKKLGVK